MRNIYLLLMSGILMVLHLLFSCTTNPFSKESVIEKNVRTVAGNIQLSDQAEPESIYVWLDEFDMGTFTNPQGEFSLTLPAPQEQPGGGVSGVISLYFYVVNYEIYSVKVVLRDGEFVYGEADIDNDGRIHDKIVLEKLLNITTDVSPKSITADFSGTIYVTITINARGKPVIISAFMNEDNIINGMFIRHQTFKNKLVGQYIMPNSHVQTRQIGTTPLRSVSQYHYNICELPKGTYEIIPFIWINQNNIPEELVNNFTDYPVMMSPDYLKLPFKLSVPTIEIEYCDHIIGDPP